MSKSIDNRTKSRKQDVVLTAEGILQLKISAVEALDVLTQF